MRRLESQGVDRRQIVYLTFEDDRLLPIETRELDLILQAHAALYPEFNYVEALNWTARRT
jgi:hypothetical protein